MYVENLRKYQFDEKSANKCKRASQRQTDWDSQLILSYVTKTFFNLKKFIFDV
jgi:hypothetical protein